jgi:hypothetical protein
LDIKFEFGKEIKTSSIGKETILAEFSFKNEEEENQIELQNHLNLKMKNKNYKKKKDPIYDVEIEEREIIIDKFKRATSKKIFKKKYLIQIGGTKIYLKTNLTKIIETLGTEIIMRRNQDVIHIYYAKGEGKVIFTQGKITSYLESFYEEWNNHNYKR